MNILMMISSKRETTLTTRKLYRIPIRVDIALRVPIYRREYQHSQQETVR
jgi:hypothetical protein